MTSPALADETAADGDSIIVTGTRTQNRTALQSLAPVDVLSADDLRTSGKQSVRDLLGALAPSITVSNSGAGASFAVKSLSLRGLGSDQLLVLVNGKRRHSTAALFINGTTQNGQSPVDLDLIPATAIRRVEILRDGAAAQYGSDAIAGVVNVILKDDVAAGAALWGGANGDGGGETGRAQVDHGFHIGGGVVHLSAEGYVQARTVRAGPNPGQFFARGGGLYPGTGAADPREATVDRNVNRGGQPQSAGVALTYNASIPLGGATFYSFGSWARRNTDAWLTFRFPDASNNIPENYPLGYVPRLFIKDNDFQVVGGIKGTGPGGIAYDLSTSYSENRVRYNEKNAINVSLGPASPTAFYLGTVRASEWTTNLDLRRDVDTGLAGPLSIALGAEYRDNGYGIDAGDPASYADGNYISSTGPNAGVLRNSSSQGVAGFSPNVAGRFGRHSWSAYLNLEQAIAQGVELSLAGRHEDYSDFGRTDTGKASLRIEPVQGFALRGTASTGFRAPTLQQQHYASSSTIPVGGILLPIQALPVDSPVAIALGAKPLKAERSTNFSAGFVFDALPRFTLSVDAYQVKIRDRILLSETLQGAAVVNVLRAAGITSSAGGFYFSNAADTRTRGIDVVATYRADLVGWGALNFSLSANVNKTVFTRVAPPPPELAAAGLVLIGRQRQGDFTRGQLRDKIIGVANWSSGPFSANLRGTRYGKVTQVHATSAALDATVSPKVIFDLELGYDLKKGVRLTAGANNLFNIYPDVMPTALQSNGFTLYNPFSPYGVSGGFYYGRLSFGF